MVAKQTGEAIHPELYNDFQSQRNAIAAGKVDLIYANPFDAAMLVREHGFLPLVKAINTADEALIAVRAESGITDVAQLQPGVRVAFTSHPDVHLIGMIMLEPADLSSDNIVPVAADSYVLVAKQVLKGEAEAGIFPAQAYDNLSAMVKSQLKVLVRSQISVIHHALPSVGMTTPGVSNTARIKARADKYGMG